MKSDAYQTQNQDPDLLLRPDQRAKLGNVPAHPVPLLVLPVFAAVFLSVQIARACGQPGQKVQDAIVSGVERCTIKGQRRVVNAAACPDVGGVEPASRRGLRNGATFLQCGSGSICQTCQGSVAHQPRPTTVDSRDNSHAGTGAPQMRPGGADIGMGRMKPSYSIKIVH